MAKNQIKIEVNNLRNGMFVANLDRPWHETPFPLQGFYIQKDDDVKALTQYCKFVYVDIEKQRGQKSYEQHASTVSTSDKKQASALSHTESKVVNLPPIVIKSPVQYGASVTMKKEVAKISRLHRHVYEAIGNVFSALNRGDELSVQETEKVAEGMVDSVIRNPDALVWLAKMNEGDAYTYQHSVKASIWALVFGRHLGLDKGMLKALAMGVLLSHIGKTQLDTMLLIDPESIEEASIDTYRKYVEYGVEIAEGMDDLPKGAFSIIKYHQERHNGSGYPQGLSGEKIPLLAKIGGLVDFYQSLITPRDDKFGLSPLEAVAKLYELRNISFQQDLVERFIEAVGVYPTGTLVELNSNAVGIVTGHHPDRRLQPQVMVVLDEHKQPLKAGKLIDLREHNKRFNGERLMIKNSLPKGAYDVDESAYLVSGATSKWSWKHISSAIAS